MTYTSKEMLPGLGHTLHQVKYDHNRHEIIKTGTWVGLGEALNFFQNKIQSLTNFNFFKTVQKLCPNFPTFFKNT